MMSVIHRAGKTLVSFIKLPAWHADREGTNEIENPFRPVMLVVGQPDAWYHIDIIPSNAETMALIIVI